MLLSDIQDMAKSCARQPFAINLADGRSLEVRHPEFLMLPVEGPRFVFFSGGNGVEVVALSMVVSLKTLPPKKNKRSK